MLREDIPKPALEWSYNLQPRTKAGMNTEEQHDNNTKQLDHLIVGCKQKAVATLCVCETETEAFDFSVVTLTAAVLKMA